MPLYEYRCQNDHRFEVLQKFSDDPIEVCEVCGAPAQRVLHPVAIHFKGSGFYSTDYGRGKKASASSDGKGESSGGDSKPAAKTESKSEGSSSPKAAEA
ncbi:MAG: FmdB family zinc ribbon protein [Gaiellales bacterium]